MKVLHIIANPKPDEASYSRKLARTFLNAYKLAHPTDTVEILDLYKEQVPYFDAIDLSLAAKKGQGLTPEEETRRAMKEKWIAQLFSADKIVVSYPMWNFAVPAILRSYIDHIVFAGRTFRYTAEGPEGLIKGKKICFVSARGGDYSSGVGDFSTPHMKKAFAFVGIKDAIELHAEGTLIPDFEARWEHIVRTAQQEAERF